jgi:tetratricopeptide (TPR) repeat protein
MDHYTEELEHSLPEAAKTHPAGWTKEQLRQCAAELLDEPARYKLYGSYWWGLKHLLRQAQIGPRSAWFHGPCSDEGVRRLSDHGSTVLNLHAALTRARLWDDGLVWLERPEASLCICEWPDGQVELYRLSDTDTGHQLDLFEMAERQERRLQQYLDSVAEFLPRTWRNHGEEALEDHNPDRAVVCYQRMAHLATSRNDRSEAWLLLGMTFDQKKHWNKAVFCYRNLFEKENEHWILGNIAASCFNAGQIREAISWYEQALKHMPGNPEFLAGLAAAHHHLGKMSPATGDRDQLALELAHA